MGIKKLASVKEKCENMDQKIGVEIIERACRAPLKAIANNAVRYHTFGQRNSQIAIILLTFTSVF